MHTVTITFLADHVKQNSLAGTADETRYRKGRSYDVSESTAARYIKRGLAQPGKADLIPLGTSAATATPAPSTGTARDPDPNTVEIPENWRDVPWPELRALAAKVSPEAVRDKKDAILAIEAELDRRRSQTGSQTGPAA